MIRHHPDQDLLLAYAAGAADEAIGLIVATHMALCGECRAAVTAMEKIGGGLLEALPPAQLEDAALAGTMAKLDGVTPYERPPRTPSRDGTPDVLRGYIGGDLSAARWRRMGPKLAYLPLFRRGRTRVKLLRGVPGTEVGAHSHRGLEFTLVLAGGFTDGTGSYGPGDMQVADGALRHNPVADPGEDCINLAVTTAPLTFDNWLQKLAAPLFGF